MQLSREKIVEIIKYLFVGGSTALLELVLFTLLSNGVDLPVANVVAVCISTVCNYILNKIWSFNSREWNVKSVVLYLLLFTFNTTFSSWFITTMATLGLPPVGAKVLSMACIVTWNYVLYRNVIFK